MLSRCVAHERYRTEAEGDARVGQRTQRGWLMAALLVLPIGLAGAATDAAVDPLFEAGRRLYEEGILPDGSALRAVRPEGFVLEGRQAACAACHRASGMGAIEGLLERTVLVPPVAGPLLYAPARFHGSVIDTSHHYVPNAAWARALTRPAYDLPSLGRALREGIDPAGRPLVAPMPRYPLDDAALSALDAYLRRLTAAGAPGDEADALHLATVATPDAPPGQTETVLGVLRAWSATARPSGKPWRLHVWALTGPPTGWLEQLRAHYRERPVFAILSGTGGAEWDAVHVFCETERVPCLLPALERGPDAPQGGYALYYSLGTGLEARLIAHYLLGAYGGHPAPPRIVQLYADASGERAAAALCAALGTSGGTLQPIERRIDTLTRREDLGAADVLVLWLRPDALAQLTALLPEGPGAPQVFLSALLAPPEATRLPPAWRARVIYASLFDDLGLQGEIARLRLRRWLSQRGVDANPSTLRAAADAYAAAYLFTAALAEIRAQEARRPRVPLSREHLLETLETLVNKYTDGTGRVNPDSHVAFYGRMSLGPGQRVAVRGGTLLRYASPDGDMLSAASERIVP